MDTQTKCSKCGAVLNDAMWQCPACMADVGAPNVRSSCSKENLNALEERFAQAKALASENDCPEEFDILCDIIKNNSAVVISMPASVARSLLENTSDLYTNYDKLVGAQARVPASPCDDRHRSAVAGILFGSYANSIIYGALSLTNYGLGTYGCVHCKLKPIAIQSRTSFLEMNSYKFIQEKNISAGEKLPAGYTASWNDRQKLVLAKITGSLEAGQKESDWQKLILKTDNQNREDDDFVEAHIFGGFNWYAIESLEKTSDLKLKRAEELDFDLAKVAFMKHQGMSK